jgi:hypothetical protein
MAYAEISGVAVLLALSAGVAASLGFESTAEGGPPKGWSVAMTHEGGAPKWQVILDGDRKVLAQVSRDATGGRFPLAIYDGATMRDGTISVRFKPVGGVVDQAAGIVWRYRDAGNYYVVRANALEDNVALFKVEGGERTALSPKTSASSSYAVSYQIPKQAWSNLSVAVRDNAFSVSLNGKWLFDVDDATFAKAGKVGLWTKADSVTYFDDFRYVPVGGRGNLKAN